MRQSAVSFTAKGMNLEGIIALPDGDGPFPGVVMCHPHPLHGGNMDNNVVVAVTFGLADAGIASLRFNFRGVGNSQGEHAQGEKEHEETLVAMDFLGALPDVDDDRIGLGGYSFSTRVICAHKQLYKKPPRHRPSCSLYRSHHQQPVAVRQNPQADYHRRPRPPRQRRRCR